MDRSKVDGLTYINKTDNSHLDVNGGGNTATGVVSGKSVDGDAGTSGDTNNAAIDASQTHGERSAN